MAKVKTSSMKIAGMAAAIPKNHTTIYEFGEKYFDKSFIETMNKTVGVDNFYFCDNDQGSGDLGYAAANRLLEMMDWDRESIDGILFVSQSLDYIIPPTSIELQHKLKLNNDVFTMDMNYGCAGFIMGLIVANQFLQAGTCKRILLINAECHRRFIADEDRENSLLFGDGATATAIEATESGSESFFTTYVDGGHAGDIILGLYKKACNINKYGEEYSCMNGESVTQFMLRNIPKLVNSLLDFSKIDKSQIDSYLFHQANAHMVKYVSKRMKLDLNAVPINIGNYGNISSASIPLLICDKKKSLFQAGSKEKVLLAGFGAGFLLAGAVIELGELQGGDIIFV